MSKAFELKYHNRCQFEALEARCLLAVEFIDTGQELIIPELEVEDAFTIAVALDDLDGDGDVDAFVIAPRRSAIATDPAIFDKLRSSSVWMNDGLGNFRFEMIASRSGTSVALGDTDGDGDIDAMVDGRPLVNDGGGVFSDTGDFPRFGSNPFHGLFVSVLGDLDGDGDLDTISVEGPWSRGDRHVWLNDGDGKFSHHELFGVFEQIQDMALADFDGDNDLDAVVAGGVGTGDNSVWLNDGTGRFTRRATVGESVVSHTVAAGDLDGDNDVDIILGNGDIFLNDGNGTFEEAFRWLGNSLLEDIALGDVDNDGDLDAITAGGRGDGNHLWINDGDGFFEIAQDFGSEGFAAALGDLDNDGDLDAYIGHLGPDKIWLNQLITTSRLPGDANGDGEFNRDDIVQVLQAGKFMTGEPASWEEGDWNGDGRFDQLDLIAALQENSYSSVR